MAQAVAQSPVAVLAEIGVQVVFARHRQFRNRRGVLQPVEVEILPESGRAVIQHPAPEAADQLQRRSGRLRQKHVVAVEGADAAERIARQYVGTVRDSAQRQHRGRRLAVAAVGDVAHHPPRELQRAGSVDAERAAELRAALECAAQQPLQPGVHRDRIVVVRPVEEAARRHRFGAVLIHIPLQLSQQAGQVRPLFL